MKILFTNHSKNRFAFLYEKTYVNGKLRDTFVFAFMKKRLMLFF